MNAHVWLLRDVSWEADFPTTANIASDMFYLGQNIRVDGVIGINQWVLVKLIESINEMNYGLTLGLHSRIDNTINYIFKNANIGNIYINRNITGAVVGVQPFGGRGLSGTGPKAGGPNYLINLLNEKTYSHDMTTSGGNASLFMLPEKK